MKPSRKFHVLALAVALCAPAFAGGIGNTYNQPQATANGGKGGEGGNATAGAVSAAVSTAGAQASANQTLVLGATTAQLQVNESQRPVASAVATGLVAANGTCMGSSSVGGQGATLGLSFGTTWESRKCDTRYDVAMFASLGLLEAAVARACQEPDNRAAIEATGKTCPSAKPAATPTAANSAYTGNDPYVLKRLASK